VQKKETLYGVCNKYKVDMTEVVLLNKMGGNGYSLTEGEILLIPLYAKKPLIDVKDIRLSDDGYITHVVKQGETLFSISRNYNGITPQMIRDKNSLKSDTLKINQQLLIPQQINQAAIYKKPKAEPAALPPDERASNSNRLFADNEKLYKTFEASAATIEVTRGIASWQENDQEENQKNFYALHKYAPIGTIIKVRNLMNNREAYVKVIGKLPDIEVNKSITVMVSGATARYLNVFDAKFLVELTIPAGEKGVDESRK
jgi:LysM repeat protein